MVPGAISIGFAPGIIIICVSGAEMPSDAPDIVNV